MEKMRSAASLLLTAAATVFAFGCLIPLSAASSRRVDDVMADSGETERIVGGVEAHPGQFPWTVALHYDYQFICTASILDSRTVLTAAHCVKINDTLLPAELLYGIANVNRKSPVVRIDFEVLVPHPDYRNGSVHNDIAVLKTLREIEFGGEVGPVCIAGPDKPELRCRWKNATAMGWGDTVRDRNVEFYPDRLHYTEVKIVGNLECGLLNSGIDEDKICAKGCVVRLLPGICVGDSGGPLVRLSADNAPVQTGVAAYINRRWGCGSIAAGVFTRVSSYHHFIREHAEDAGRSLCVVDASECVALDG